MEEQRNRMNDFSDREDRSLEIVLRINRHITAQLDSGSMVRRNLVSERTGEILYLHDRLATTTRTDHSTGTDDVSQLELAVEGFERHIISGVGLRGISQVNGLQWQLESIWDAVDINHITVAEDQRDARITTDENITIWWRSVKDWSRPDGNILSIQTLWSGNFSYSERLLQLLENVNTVNSVQIFNPLFILHLDMREQYIARHETIRVVAAYSVVDSSITEMDCSV